MNPDNENERLPAPNQDLSASPEAGRSDAEGAADGARPGTTDVQAYIGRQLRAVYDDVVKQPIPDRFLALMKQLEEQGAKT
ncbi:NepR family anti-sigma factor [Lichenibacterium ramalinae]|uniref:Anti-sigma factor NepR domain-containing protein n=1 Tax=Lichenibacterium ramalinae TaxID=2316527 RepID=A0A4Q2RH51_9HYPH|nr:NepR family anti-sigma factor [Lichenibacterium ramalinae]RYB07002.1 hypothetical protein D3272_02655 [Lichenibacterium ramalinae]